MLALLSTGASATFKCIDQGHVTYTDVACASGRLLPSDDLRDTGVLRADSLAAEQRAEADKNRLKLLLDERQKVERSEALQALKTSAATNKRRHLCTALSLRKKWLEEDVTSASKRSARKVKTRLTRIKEQLSLECGATG